MLVDLIQSADSLIEQKANFPQQDGILQQTAFGLEQQLLLSPQFTGLPHQILASSNTPQSYEAIPYNKSISR